MEKKNHIHTKGISQIRFSMRAPHPFTRPQSPVWSPFAPISVSKRYTLSFSAILIIYGSVAIWFFILVVTVVSYYGMVVSYYGHLTYLPRRKGDENQL